MSPIAAIKSCEQAFRLAGICNAYLKLKLPIHLKNETSIDELASIIEIHPEGLERFLNATTFLGLTKKTGKKYQHNKEVVYSDEATKVLIALIERKLPDQINNQTLNVNSLDESSKHLLDKAVKYRLILKTKAGKYQLYEETKPYLCSTGQNYIGPKLYHYQRVMLKTFEADTIIRALKENKSQWTLIAGHNIATAFDLYKTEPELLEIFTRGMHVLNAEDNDVLAQAIPLSPRLTILDIGGGSGSFTLSLLHQESALDITIYEHSDAISLMKKIFEEYATDEQIRHVKFVSGNFMQNQEIARFSGLSPELSFNMICLAWILHDWSDDTCKNIIKKAYHHLSPNGHLIVIEEIMPDDKISSTCISDLTMLLHTEGKERTFKEYKNLLIWGGFKEENISHKPTNTRRQLIIAKKA